MKGLVYTAPYHIEVRDLPDPQPGSEDVIIDVGACGICGSDLHGFQGKSAIRVPPMVMGHEFCGRVVAASSDADPASRYQAPASRYQATASKYQALVTGTRVVVQPLVGCGLCAFCLSGRSNICPSRQLIGAHRQGAFSEYVRVPASQIYPVSDALDDATVTLVEPLANAVHMLALADGVLGKSVAVLGAGALGLLTVALARHAGAHTVVATDIDQSRRDVAHALGASDTVDAREDDATGRIRQITGGADVVVDAAGYSASREQAIAVAAPGATVILLGLADPRSEFSMGDIINREIAVRGSYSCTDADFRTALRLLEDGAIETSSWVQVGSLEDGPGYFERLVNHESGLIKVVLAV